MVRRATTDGFECKATAVDEEATAAPVAACPAACPAPSSEPAQSETTAHIYNDEAEAWFCKIHEVQGARGHKDHALLERDFPQSNITGYDLAKDKIIYLWGVQGRERAIEVEKKRK